MFLTTQESRVSTQNLYKLFGYNEHRNLKQTVAKHLAAFESLGPVIQFQTGTTEKGGRPSDAYALNLAQSLLLSGLVKNSSGSKKVEVISALVQAYEKASLLSVLDIVANIDVDELEKDRFVYVVRESESGRYKIGISKDPAARVKQLNVGNPEKLELVHAYLATEDGYKSEALAHALFEKERLAGEWFNGSIDLTLLPSYDISCKADTLGASCACKNCEDYALAFDILSNEPAQSRDFFIGKLIDSGFEFKDAIKHVDALEDTGVIAFANIIGKSHVHALELSNH